MMQSGGKLKGERDMNNEPNSECVRCESADGELYKWTYVSTKADEVVGLCLPCFQYALDRQCLAVKENADVLQSVSVSSVEYKKSKENLWVVVGGALVVVAVVVFLFVQTVETLESPQGICPGPYYNPDCGAPESPGIYAP